ncbi:IS3 family transposase [Kurthia sibirica]
MISLNFLLYQIGLGHTYKNTQRIKTKLKGMSPIYYRTHTQTIAE